MSDTIMLEQLLAIRGDITNIKLDFADMKKSLTAIEAGVADWAAMQGLWGERLRRHEAAPLAWRS